MLQHSTAVTLNLSPSKAAALLELLSAPPQYVVQQIDKGGNVVSEKVVSQDVIQRLAAELSKRDE